MLHKMSPSKLNYMYNVMGNVTGLGGGGGGGGVVFCMELTKIFLNSSIYMLSVCTVT